MLDDSALAYCGSDGLVIITGCSHAWICSIIEHARSICQEERVVNVIGGLHLLQSHPGSSWRRQLSFSVGWACRRCMHVTVQI